MTEAHSSIFSRVLPKHSSAPAWAGASPESQEEAPMPEIRYPQWQPMYQEAITELDLEKLHQKVFAAETGIFKRLQELSGSNDHQEERLALSDAISGLRVLKTEQLKFPDWKSR